MSGLSGRPLQFTQTNPLLVFAYSLVDVAFEPGFFGCHLKPHDAPARACAYCSRNPRGSSAVFIFRRESHIGMIRNFIVRRTVGTAATQQAGQRLTSDCVQYGHNAATETQLINYDN